MNDRIKNSLNTLRKLYGPPIKIFGGYDVIGMGTFCGVFIEYDSKLPDWEIRYYAREIEPTGRLSIQNGLYVIVDPNEVHTEESRKLKEVFSM